MFTASLEIMDIDTETRAQAALSLLDCAGIARPLTVFVRDQATGEETKMEVLDHTPAFDLLERCLDAWEDEEDSVQEEHAELIADLRKFLGRE